MDSILFIQPNADWITHREGTQSYNIYQSNADWITHREWTQFYLYSLMQTGLHIEKGLNPIYSLMQTGLHIEKGLNPIYTA
jgi:hypothetical protein